MFSPFISHRKSFGYSVHLFISVKLKFQQKELPHQKAVKALEMNCKETSVLEGNKNVVRSMVRSPMADLLDLRMISTPHMLVHRLWTQNSLHRSSVSLGWLDLTAVHELEIIST